MKVTIKEDPKVFTPVTLELTIESEEELCNLWHRANVCYKYINNYSYDSYLKFKMNGNTTPFFKVLDKLVEDLNLVK